MSGHRVVGFVFFGLAILVGLAAGVTYGWVVNPAPPTENPAQTLRFDYQVDVILMVAELYRVEDDIAQAVNRLAFLGIPLDLSVINAALTYAERYAYDADDITAMQALGTGLSYLLMESD